MEARRLDIIGLAETRMKEHGRKTIHNDYELIYSGRSDNCDHGVGMILSPEYATHIQNVMCKNERILAVTFKINDYRITLIQTYAPQQGRSQEEKDLFYNQLQEVCDQSPIDSDIVIMGDLNGHIGSNRIDGVIGEFGIGEQNMEGEMLIDFCVRNNLAIMNTYFQHRDSHKYTWYRYNSNLGSYDLKTQIDFFLTSKKSIVKDVKAIPSISLDSDHRLLKAKLKIHKPQLLKQPKRQRLLVENVSLKKQEIQTRFEEDRRLIQGDDVIEFWEPFKEVVQKIEREVVGVKIMGGRRKKTTMWWNDEVKEAIRNKQESFRLWMKERTPERRRAYGIYRNIVNLCQGI